MAKTAINAFSVLSCPLPDSTPGCPRRRGEYAPSPEKMMGVLNVSTELTQWYAQNKSDLSGLNAVVEEMVLKYLGRIM